VIFTEFAHGGGNCAPSGTAGPAVALRPNAFVLGDQRQHDGPVSVYLKTERLFLQRFSDADADLLIELDSDPAVMRYLSG